MMLESVDELKDISLKLKHFGWKHADKLFQPMAVKVARHLHTYAYCMKGAVRTTSSFLRYGGGDLQTSISNKWFELWLTF